MKLAQRIRAESDGSGISGIPLQSASLDIWRQYPEDARRTSSGSRNRRNYPVSHVRSPTSNPPRLRALWHERFLWALRQGASGRTIVSNAGGWNQACEYRPSIAPCGPRTRFDGRYLTRFTERASPQGGLRIATNSSPCGPRGVRHGARFVHVGPCRSGHPTTDVLHRLVGRRTPRGRWPPFGRHPCSGFHPPRRRRRLDSSTSRCSSPKFMQAVRERRPVETARSSDAPEVEHDDIISTQNRSCGGSLARATTLITNTRRFVSGISNRGARRIWEPHVVDVRLCRPDSS